MIETSVAETLEIDGNTTSYSTNAIKANVRIRIEQDVDLSLKTFEPKILGQTYDEVILTTDRRYKQYKANKDRIILKGGLTFRKEYGKTGIVKYYQVLIPKQLADEVLRSLHGEFRNHPGLTKTIVAHRKKYNYPNMAQISGNGSCPVNNALENYGAIVDSPTRP